MNPLELRRDKACRIFYAGVLGLVYVMYMMTLDMVGIPSSILKSYAPILVFAVMGLGLYRGDYGGISLHSLGLVFVLWYVISRVFLGDGFLMRSFVTVMDLCVLYCVALPFVRLFGDGEKRRILDTLVLVYVLTLAVIAWMGIWFSLKHTGRTMPLSGQLFGLPEGGQLQILGQKPGVSALLLAAAFYMGVYLLAARWKKYWVAPAIAVLLGLYLALALTADRLGILAFGICFAVLGGVLAARIRISSKVIKVAVVVFVCLLCLLAALLGTQLALDVLSRISAAVSGNEAAGYVLAVNWNEQAKNSAPGEIRAYLGQVLSQNPRLMLLGSHDTAVMTAFTQLTGTVYQQMHNSFLQVLMLMGIPGLLLALVLTAVVLWSALKLLLATAELGEQLLCLAPLVLLIGGMGESVLFVPWSSMSWSLLDFLFLLFCGYLLEAGKKYSIRDLLKK